MGLGLKRLIVEALDRAGGRTMLGTGVTVLARLRGFNNVRVFFEDGRWFHKVGDMTFPGRRRFDQWPYRFGSFAMQRHQYIADARDYWMFFITPSLGAVVIDVGAGEGEDVLAFSHCVGEHGRVLAIEAFPSTFEVLQEFCSRNRLMNTVPVHLALGANAGSISFEESSHWVENSIATDPTQGVEVRSAQLGTVCTEYGISKIDYLKMNIEGAEVQALKGMVDVFPIIRTICVSCHDFRAERGDGEQFRTRKFVIDFLSRNGFELKFRDDPRPHVRDQVFGVRAII